LFKNIIYLTLFVKIFFGAQNKNQHFFGLKSLKKGVFLKKQSKIKKTLFYKTKKNEES
jgi:hypothetical protein